MITRSIKNRINNLRQQPDHIKYRAVTILTAISGTFIAIVWLTVLLPFQLRHNNQPEPKQEQTNQISENQDIPALNKNGQVGGILSSPQANPNNNDSAYNNYLPSSLNNYPSPSISPTPTPTMNDVNLLPSNEPPVNQ